MPKEVHKIEQFHGGLSSNSDPRDIAESELSEATDIMVDELGKIRMMGSIGEHQGYTSDLSHIISINSGYGLFQFSHDRLGGGPFEHLDETDFDDIYQRIIHLIQSLSFKQMHENSIYSKEQPLIYNNEVKILDLLIKKEDKYIIIDYKTTANKESSHITQVQIYKNGIKKIFQESDENIIGYIVYLNQDTVEFIKVK